MIVKWRKINKTNSLKFYFPSLVATRFSSPIHLFYITTKQDTTKPQKQLTLHISVTTVHILWILHKNKKITTRILFMLRTFLPEVSFQVPYNVQECNLNL